MVYPTDPLIAKLVTKLHDQDPLTRRNAIGALRLHGPRAAETVAELTELLEDPDPRVRLEARRALERLRPLAA